MITVLATVIVLGVLIFFHELGHFLVAKLLGVRVEAFSLGFPPKLLHKKIGDTDYRLSVIPLGGYVKLLGENPSDEVPPELVPYSFLHHPLWHRVLIVLSGPVFNLIFAVLALFLVFTFSGIPYLTTEIGSVMQHSPAAQAGLQKGDRVLTVGSQPVQRWDELSRLIRHSGDQRVALTIKRGDQVLKAEVRPRVMAAPDIFGSETKALIIGITPSDHPVMEKVNPVRAFSEGFIYTWRLSYLNALALGKLLAREVPLKSMGGPILIAQLAGKQAKIGVSALVTFMAALSVNLFLLNLLPIPILDGGHLFFFIIEAVRGKPVEIKYREMAQGVGLMIILALMILVFYQDIVRLFNPTP
jgi:regulator of sigma E protease